MFRVVHLFSIPRLQMHSVQNMFSILLQRIAFDDFNCTIVQIYHLYFSSFVAALTAVHLHMVQFLHGGNFGCFMSSFQKKFSIPGFPGWDFAKSRDLGIFWDRISLKFYPGILPQKSMGSRGFPSQRINLVNFIHFEGLICF